MDDAFVLPMPRVCEPRALLYSRFRTLRLFPYKLERVLAPNAPVLHSRYVHGVVRPEQARSRYPRTRRLPRWSAGGGRRDFGQVLERSREFARQTDTGSCGRTSDWKTAGRVCYMSFAKPRPGGNHAYLNHILEVGHGSVLEHAVWCLVITGVSRSLTHELVRHRAGFSYSQLSQRYVDESVAEYVEPDAIGE